MTKTKDEQAAAAAADAQVLKDEADAEAAFQATQGIQPGTTLTAGIATGESGTSGAFADANTDEARTARTTAAIAASGFQPRDLSAQSFEPGIALLPHEVAAVDLAVNPAPIVVVPDPAVAAREALERIAKVRGQRAELYHERVIQTDGSVKHFNQAGDEVNPVTGAKLGEEGAVDRTRFSFPTRGSSPTPPFATPQALATEGPFSAQGRAIPDNTIAAAEPNGPRTVPV